MNQVSIGQWVRIQSFKHDGSLHRTWDHAMVVECTDSYIVVASKTSRVIESDGRHWFTKEPAISIFFLKDWFNTIAMLRKDDIYYYCNIASPTYFEEGTLKYIDYDLDVKWMPDGTILGLDEKEYDYHRKKYQYSEDLDFVCKGMFEQVKEKMKKSIFPFSKEKMDAYYAFFLQLYEQQENTN